jgi:hypothetical protein
MRHVASGRTVERSAASTSVMSRFETEILTQPKNLGLPSTWVRQVHKGSTPKQIILDMDSSGQPNLRPSGRLCLQQLLQVHLLSSAVLFQSVWGHGANLPSQWHVHSADDWHSVLESVIARYRGYDIRRLFRGYSFGKSLPGSSSCVFDNACEAMMRCGTAQNRLLEWR